MNARRPRALAFAALTLAPLALIGFSTACNAILGNVDLELVADASARDGAARATDATLSASDDAESRTDGEPRGDDGEAADSPSGQDATGDAGDDGDRDADDNEAGLAALCPFDGGCPCEAGSCSPRPVSFEFTGFEQQLLSRDDVYTVAQDDVSGTSVATGVITDVFDDIDGGYRLASGALVPDGGILLTAYVQDDHGGTTYSIWQISRSGGPPVVVVANSGQNFATLAGTASRAYWGDDHGNLRSVLLDGGAPQNLDAGVLGTVVADDQSVYYSVGNAIVRAPLDLSQVSASIGPADLNSGLAVDDTTVYWTGPNGHGLYSAPRNFDGGTGTLIYDALTGFSIAFDDEGFVYFYDVNSSALMRCRRPACAGGTATLFIDPNLAGLAGGVGGHFFYVTVDSSQLDIITEVQLH